MSILSTRHGNITAVDTWTALESFGANTSKGAIKAPANYSHIVKIISEVGISHDNTDGDNSCALLQVGGAGVQGGAHELVVGGAGSGAGTQTGEYVAGVHQELDVKIPVVPGNDIDLKGKMVGSDVMVATMGITLVFGNTQGQCSYRTSEGDISAVNTVSTLGSQSVPAGAKKIAQIIGCAPMSWDTSLDQGVVIGSLAGNGLAEGAPDVVIGSLGSGNGTGTGEPYGVQARVLDVDIPVIPTNTIDLTAMQVGDDVMASNVAITLVYQ